MRQPKALPAWDLTADPSWPTPETAKALGQLSGVSIDTYGNAIIFHRGDRTWTGQTFNRWRNMANLINTSPCL